MALQRPRRMLGVRSRAFLALFAGILAPLLVFGLLAEDVREQEGFAWDVPILEALHARATPALDATMVFFTRIGDPLPMLALVALVFLALLARRHVHDALSFALAVGGAEVLNLAAKLTFRRARPSLWPTLLPEHDYGFPSGHAMGSLAVVAALSILAWQTRWRWPVMIGGGLFAAAVGLSRIYLGVHYPSDILAGWSASLAWVIGVRLLLRAPWSRWWDRADRKRHPWQVVPRATVTVTNRRLAARRSRR